MKKKALIIPVLALTLLLGVAAGLATADIPADGGSTSTTAPASTTDPGTTTGTTPTSTDATTSTDPTTSTAPATSTDTTTTTTTTPTSTGTTTTAPTTSTGTTTTTPTSTATTTVATTTTANTSTAATTTDTTPTTSDQAPSISQSTVQGTTTATTSPTTTHGATTTTGSSPPPTAPCETTQLTCGNNASTQVAIVSQTCNAASGGAVLAIDVETANGAPVGNVTINPSTTCLNELAITQVVQQYCVGCTIIVIPPPPPAIPYAVTTTVVVGGDDPPPPAPSPDAERVMAYCMPTPMERPDGTVGTLLYLDEGQPEHDPTYAKAIPATYVPGTGMTCPTGSAGPKVPMFTLTVPASLVGQYVRLCLQPANPAAKPLCHDIRIDTGATIAVPVTSSVSAKVVKKRLSAAQKPKSKKAIAKQSSSFALALTTRKAPRLTTAATHSTKHSTKHSTMKGRRLP